MGQLNSEILYPALERIYPQKTDISRSIFHNLHKDDTEAIISLRKNLRTG